MFLISLFEFLVTQMMFFLNFWAILSVAVVLVVTGQMTTGIDFFLQHPSVISEAALFSLLSAFGQAAILLTLEWFDSLVLVTITT